MRGYAFHPGVYDDLDNMLTFIGQQSEVAAAKVYHAIHDTIQALVPQPYQGHQRSDLTDLPLRFVSVYDYLIAYAPAKKPLWVLAVLHGHRNPQVLSAILRARDS